jgi:hypothetical protein
MNIESNDISPYYAKIRETTTWLHNKIVHMITMPLKLRFIGHATQFKKHQKGYKRPTHRLLEPLTGHQPGLQHTHPEQWAHECGEAQS